MADELALPVKKTSRKASEAAAAKTDPETEGQYGRAEVFIRQFYRQHPPEENQQGFEGFKSWSDGDWDAKIERIIGTFLKKAKKKNGDPWQMLHYSFAERYQEKAKVVIDLVNSKFAELDADGNGMLDEGELSALTEGAGAERTTAEAVKLFFAMADKDNDGQVTQEEAKFAGLKRESSKSERDYKVFKVLHRFDGGAYKDGFCAATDLALLVGDYVVVTGKVEGEEDWVQGYKLFGDADEWKQFPNTHEFLQEVTWDDVPQTKGEAAAGSTKVASAKAARPASESAPEAQPAPSPNPGPPSSAAKLQAPSPNSRAAKSGSVFACCASGS